MALQIDEAILKKTTECPNELKCLNRAEYPLCRAENRPPVGDYGIFVITIERNSCSYKIPFGYSHMCKCPTRMELYKRHKK